MPVITSWKAGISKTFDQIGGVTLMRTFVDTNVKDGAYVSPSGKNLGRNGVVFSLVKTF